MKSKGVIVCVCADNQELSNHDTANKISCHPRSSKLDFYLFKFLFFKIIYK